MYGFWGWFNNWPLIRFVMPVVVFAVVLCTVLGLLAWAFILMHYFPWIGIFVLVCIVVGIAIALAELLLGRHRSPDTDPNG